MYDQEKKKSRGFGFLSFEDENARERAVAEHFVAIQNKQVHTLQTCKQKKIVKLSLTRFFQYM